jgi:glycosyltransferase involved in cell wall biosynthesis
MKIAFVVQRYGLEINGGAELHCRWVTEHMKKYAEVEVLTTKAVDYLTWKDYYPRDMETINGIRVRRSPVIRPRDPVVGLRIFQDLFRTPRAIIYNSVEERRMIHDISRNEHVPGDVVGVGTEVPGRYSGEAFRQKYSLTGPYILYLGRIDENKGCHRLFDYFIRFKRDSGFGVKLVLAGNTVMQIPSHPDIIYLGFMDDEEKFDALDGAELLAMPSFYESLSMVTLEAWAVGRPVLANALCNVLKGQCLRSNGGLFYETYPEFREALSLLLSSPRLRHTLGENGRRYFEANYTWEVIENKYLALLSRLETEKSA